MSSLTPLKFAAPYSPERCRWHRDENMALARRVSRTDLAVNREIVVGAIKRARDWNRYVIAGGNEAYRAAEQVRINAIYSLPFAERSLISMRNQAARREG